MKPKTKYRKLSLTPPQRRLRAAMDRHIREYTRLRELLHLVDAEVFEAGKTLCASDPGLAAWLCEPARALGGEIPLRAMRTAKGRKKVADILRAIAHGIYL